MWFARKPKPCSEPDVRHLLIENMHSYIEGEITEGRWYHWRDEDAPKPGDFLKVCDQPAWPQSRTKEPSR